MNQINIDLGVLENSCFVVMPFSALYQTEYEKVIQPALEELNVKCIRGDEIYAKQRIMDDIWSSLRSCRFVIAELTGRNPNVLYEIGLAHAIGKPVIIITRNSEDVPFDLKDLRYLFYDTNDPFWGENLKKGLKTLIEKVIENPGIENYLPGISKIEKTDFPKIIKTKPIKKSVEKPHDVSGRWLGIYDIGGKHSVILQINQDKTDISATTIITFNIGTKISVVQQILNGTINGLKVKLVGVNYTYVERGDSKDYNMDTFQLNYNPNEDTLTGTVSDEDGGNDKLILKRT